MISRGDHMPDDRLLGLADGELDPADAGLTEAHLATCDQCSARRRVLAEQTDRLARLLTASDWEAPPRPVPAIEHHDTRTHWWRAAAVIAVILAGSVAVGPLRAVIIKGARAGWQGIATLFTEDRRASEPPVAAASFAVGARLRIDLGRQSAGSVVIEVTDAELATVSNAGSDTRLVIMPGLLRILGSLAPAPPVVIRIPAGVREVELQEGGQVQVFRPAPGSGRWVVSFGERRDTAGAR